MNKLISKSNSFSELILDKKFKNYLIDFLSSKNENEIILNLNNQEKINIEEYILEIWNYFLEDDNLADFLIFLSNEDISEDDINLLIASYSYILKISDKVAEYSKDILQVSELTKKTITQILFEHQTEYIEFDLFNIWFPQKDIEWFYVTWYYPDNSVYIWKNLYIQIKSDNKIKYMWSNWDILKDLNWEYISNITNVIELDIDGWSSILNTINILWDKQILQYIYSQEWILQIEWEEMYIQNLKMLEMDLNNWDLIQWEKILDVLISKSSKNDYDILSYISSNKINQLNLEILLKKLNKEIKLNEYLKDTIIYKIKRVLEIWWEVFCEMDIIEKDYWFYQDWDEYWVDEDDYDEQRRSVIMDIEWNILQDKNTEEIDIIHLYQTINILWKKFLLFKDEKRELWWVIDKNWDVVKVKWSKNKQEINIFFIEESHLTIPNQENKYYKLNQSNYYISHDELIKQLEEYVSF